MVKAGMRRPDPKEPHGTESNKKNRKILLFDVYRTQNSRIFRPLNIRE